MKEKYLLSIKNTMFWYFSSSEIKDTLEEVNEHFDSALNNGVPEDEIIRQYGQVGEIIEDLRIETGQISKGMNNKSGLIKKVLLFICVCGLVYSLYVLPAKVSSSVFVILASLLIWFISGNNCIIEVVSFSRKKKSLFIKSQMMLFVIFVLIQTGTFILIPYLVRTNAGYVNSFGKYFQGITYFFMIVMLLLVLFNLKEMLCGNVLMFFNLIQGISIGYGLVVYNSFLKRLDTFENIEFVFWSYFFCMPVLFLYGLYIYMKRRGNNIGCTN